MSGARKLLISSAFVLALWGMSFGLWYALWVEHQTLDALGTQLATAFTRAATRNLGEAHGSLDAYAATAFAYVRQVDVHSHWVGLSMVLFVLGIGFDRVRFRVRQQLYLALALCAGSAVFPLGVMLQTTMRGPLPDALAIAGATMVIVSLAIVAFGFSRAPRAPMIES